MEKEEIRMIKTYRGLLADGAQEKIPLATKDGSVGYRIVKFQVVAAAPGASNYESVSQIWKKEQATAVATIDFTDDDLLGIGLWSSEANTKPYPDDMIVIFDREIFNQDIYITQQCLQSGSVNYYLELEQMKLDHTQNMSATLKAIRGSAED